MYKPEKKELQDNPHKITIEKMLVDIIAEKSISATFSPSEIQFVYENVIRNYQVDRRKMNRYAGRRGKVSQIKIYAGGTSLVLLLDYPRRLSTDIDIIVEPGTDIDYYIKKAGELFPFIDVEEHIRVGKNNIEKR